MGVLPDWAIRQLSCITPYHRGPKVPGVISFGESSAGYDISLGNQYLIFSNTCAVLVDPKSFDKSNFVPHEGDECIIPPNSFVLAESREYFEIPRDCIGLVLGKSTYARCGICTNFTPLEPAWKGKITVEIANTTPLPAKVYSGEGIAQVLFLRLEAPPERDYDQKKGNYQNQKGMTMPRVG